MNYQKRDCGISFSVDCISTGWETFCFSFDNIKYHEFTTASSVGEMLGKLIRMLYELYIERTRVYTEEDRDEAVKHICEDGGVIKQIIGKITLDNEGQTLELSISRNINPNLKMLQIHLDYDYGEDLYDYQVDMFDMFYAVSKGVTEVIKKAGLCGYHFMTDRDNIDTMKFLQIKSLALTKELIPLYTGENDISYSSIKEEMELLMFEM